MDSGWVNFKFCEEILDEELNKEVIVVASHSLLAGGGGAAVLTGVVALILPPLLSECWSYRSRYFPLRLLSYLYHRHLRRGRHRH